MRFLSLIFLLAFYQHTSAQSVYRKDFDEYWNTVQENFAYFDLQKTDWQKVKAIYGPLADTVSSRKSFIRLLEAVNNELYNGHIGLNTNLPSSFRLIPSGADLWVEYQNGRYVITAIRKGFNAEAAGLKTGMEITEVNGQAIGEAIKVLLPRSVAKHDGAMKEYAANLLLAGTHDGQRIIKARQGGNIKVYEPDRVPNMTETRDTVLLQWSVLKGNTGYIRIHNSLGNTGLIAAFDAAMDSLRFTTALIIDLRETPGGGNTTVARGIMSRFIDQELPYQKHLIPAEEKEYGVRRSWIEIVSPRGAVYKKPVVVLVGRWTGSMGEGIAIGFDGMKRATVVGDRMAGLLGAIYTFTLPQTGISFSLPAEKLFHVNGTPRESFVPRYREGDSEKALQLALKVLGGR